MFIARSLREDRLSAIGEDDQRCAAAPKSDISSWIATFGDRGPKLTKGGAARGGIKEGGVLP